MKSKIIDPDYLHWEETRQWDAVIATCMEIMYKTTLANDNKIVLDFSDEECDDDSFLLKIAKLLNTTMSVPIHINTSYWRSRKIIKSNPTYTIKKLSHKGKKNYISTSAESLKNYIKIYMPEIYTEDLFEKIYAEYWDEILTSTQVIEDNEEARIED